MPPQTLARQKQLGQYFTGQRVGRLLAALADAKTAKSIVDPMAGSADLLASCLAVGAVPERLLGVELDPLALALARSEMDRVRGAQLVLADAFSAKLPAEPFDLVITNPPYIRYQSKGEVDGVTIPCGDAVRRGLIRGIKTRKSLMEDVRDLLLHAARSYPATADIAVPAWILSASLVSEGGCLAIVAPQAWLSRNYAHHVRQLLDNAFDVEVLVEDGDASWFDDAQVRTHLVVARRRAIGAQSAGRSVVFARATRGLDVDGCLRGSLGSELDVAAALRNVTSNHSVEVTNGLTAHVEHDLSIAAVGVPGRVPPRVATALGVGPGDIETRTLESYGWLVGQGMRTGANDFFYVNYTDGAARPAARWSINALGIPAECLLPAVRRQDELGDVLDIDTDMTLPSRLVYLRGWVTAADKRRMDAGQPVNVLPTAVTRWITQVAASPLSPRHETRLFPELTAVATNIKRDRAGRPVNFWYQLPELAPRHCPLLFLGRVCGGQPTAYANSAGVVVDANFSTLWPVESDALPAEALLALLHSSWVWANLEASCTVLGGGALKVEATDLRRLSLPDLTADEVSRLSDLGRDLLARRGSGITDHVDQVVGRALAVEGRLVRTATALREFAETALGHR